MAGFTVASLRLRRALMALMTLAVFGLCLPAVASPDGIEVVQASLDANDDGWVVNAQFDINLKPRLEEWLERGQPLYFVVDFELTQPRWYWFDDKTATASLTYRLSYYPLTREYRLSTGTLQVGFSTLAEALGVLTRVHDWRVMDKGAIHAGETYIAGVRMHFDSSQLPKPILINALTGHEWTMESDWKRFSFEVTR
jgi:hypothetical protein